MAGKTHWSRLVWGDVAAESLLVETFLHGSVQQALAGVQAVYVGIGLVLQLLRDSHHYSELEINSLKIGQFHSSIVYKYCTNINFPKT